MARLRATAFYVRDSMSRQLSAILLTTFALTCAALLRAADTVEPRQDGVRISGDANVGARSWTIVLPTQGETPRVTWTVSAWRMTVAATARDTQSVPTATVTPIGLWNGVPIARVDIRPWRTRLGMVDVAKDWVVDIAFSTPLGTTYEPIVLAPWMPPCANPFYAPIVPVAKSNDLTQADADPASWLEPGQPIARLRTKKHGVASANASTILAVEPRFANAPINRLAMFHRGREQALHVYDADGSATLTPNDEILFVGREPVDDSNRLDLWDTTAVFMLALSTTADGRLRFSPLHTGEAKPTLHTPWLHVRRRIEIDTGFYHLGSGPSADFTSETALFEGFYWHQFTSARDGFGRCIHTERLYPARNGQPFSIGAIYNTLTTMRSGGIEHRVELAVNGASTEHRTSSGFEQHHLAISRPAAMFTPGSNRIAVYSPGVIERWGQPDYQSWVGLEAISVDGPIEPIAIDGRLSGDILSHESPSVLPVAGFRSADVIAIDTVHKRLGWTTLPNVGFVVSAAVAPIERATVLESWSPDQFRTELSIGDSTAHSSVALPFSFLARLPNGTTVRHSSTSEASAMAWLQGLTNDAVVAGAVLADAGASTQVRSWFRQGGANVADAPYFTVAGRVGSVTSWVHDVPGGMPEARGGTVTFVRIQGGQQYAGDVILPAADRMHLVLADEQSIEQAVVEPAVLQDLRLKSLDADVLFITHPLHRGATERLAEHRRRVTGLRTSITDVHAIRDEYGAGRLSPDAIKAYLRDAVMNAPASKRPQYLVLVGAASWDPRLAVKFGNVGSRLPDQIPTYGRPSSDYWYGLLENDSSFANPHLVVGRLPALTSEQSMYMVDKIIRQDTQAFEPWMRRMLYVGTDDQLCGIYKTLLEDPLQTGYTITGAPLCVDTITMCRFGSPPSAGFEIRQHLNAGVQFMHFHGHGAPGIFEIPAWDAPDIDNADRLGFLGTYSCQTGAFSNPSVPCKNASFLLEPDRGFVGVIGGTGWGFTLFMDILHFRIHDAMRTNGLRRIGDVLYNAKSMFGTDRFDAQGVNTAMQQCLLGDPISRVKLDTIADPFVRIQDVRATSFTGASELTQDLDDALLTITVRNAGIATDSAVRVRVVRTWNGMSDTFHLWTDGPLCSWQTVRCTLSILNKIGSHTIEVVVDDHNAIADPDANNRVVTALNVRSNALVPVEPQSAWVIPEQGASIRMLDAKPQEGSIYQLAVSRRATFDIEDVIVASTADGLSVSADGVVDWTPNVVLPSGLAWVGASVRRPATPDVPSTSWFPVLVGSLPVRARLPGRFFQPENHTIVVQNDDVTLIEPSVRIDVISAGTDTVEQDYRLRPTLRMSVGQEYGSVRLIENPYYRGFNLLMIPDGDSVPRAWRRYDTYVYPDTTWTCCINGYANELIAFLSDSIRPDERVVIALCNESLSAFTQTNRMDTVVKLLSKLGSGRAGELREGSSYILLGRLGLAPGQAVERLSNTFNTAVRLDTAIPVRPSPASALVGPFGPARKWNALQLDADEGTDSVRAELVVRLPGGGLRSVYVAPFGSGPFTIPSDVAQHGTVYIRTTIHPSNQVNQRAVVRSVGVDFIPANEWSMSSTVQSLDGTLRGDTARLGIDVRNLMPTYSSQATSVTIDVEGGTAGTSERIVVPVPPMEADGRTTVVVPVPTARADVSSLVSLELNAPPVDVPELYRFNNGLAVPLTIREDDVAPTVRMEVDDRWAFDGMYAVRRPLMRVYVYDNSWMAITDSTRVNVFINGDRMRPAVAEDWAFYPTASAVARFPEMGTQLRAVLQFRYELDRGENSVIIRSQDATGNRDTTELSIYTGDGTSVKALVVEPNPVRDRAAFVIDVAASTNDNPAVIDIYNASGSRVASLPVDLKAGRTTIPWNVQSAEGTSLSQGAYYYRLTLTASDIPISTGTFIILR